MSIHPADAAHYESLKARMERTMDNLSAAKNVAYAQEYRPNVSPLR